MRRNLAQIVRFGVARFGLIVRPLPGLRFAPAQILAQRRGLACSTFGLRLSCLRAGVRPGFG